ncbi:MAG TPA: histone deacetylase [Vicinamibacteria bacterium]|nr:histone deacetylase [Vicinamibacteria bacterium]
MRHRPLRALARAVRRSLFRIRARGIPIVHDPRYQRGLFGVPMDPLRGERVLGALEEAGLLDRDLLSEPRPASVQNLLRVHTPEYLHEVQEPDALTRILGAEVPAGEAEATIDLQRLMTGGTIQATRLALRAGGVAVHLGGGFHHAMPDSGTGFCVFNDVAVAVRRLRARGFADPVLVVDLDLHDGNGTRRVFADDPTVHTFSIHNDHWGPTEAAASTSIALGAGVEDELFLRTLRESLPPVFAAARPGLVVYVAGTDPAEDDPVGNWRLTARGLLERDRFVTALARADGGRPMVVVLAGGYGRHAWRYTARFLLWLASGREIAPVEEEALALRRFRRLGRDLRYAEAVDDGLPFSLTEEDLGALLPGPGRASRFLGYFSRHGVELLLERAGVLPQLRARGFRALRVDLEGRDGQGQTLRILSDDERRVELLVEMRAGRSRGAIAGMEVVALEWLLLQNPREPFSERRPRLPGQQHPGLGLLRDFMGWLVVVCEAHGLDGVFFVAAHYHIAMQSRRLVRPLRPEDEARLLAIAAALEGVPLAEATSAVEEGRLVETGTGRPADWHPVATVLPVSERLHALVSGRDYEEAVIRETARFAYRLEPRDLATAAPPARRRL